MEDSRPRFIESAECVLNGLENGYCQYEGQFVQQPKAAKRTYAAAVSPESVEIMAKLGIGLLVIPQKPWEVVEQEIANYKTSYERINGEAAIAGWTMCHENEKTAR